jgi:uncharacterized cupin superfamily protein
MGYSVIDPDAVEPLDNRPCEARSISDAAGLDRLGMRTYAVEPGEQMPLSYHYHDEQEEVFYVLAGTLHVETPAREFTVEHGSVFVAEPESPHRAFNPDDASATAEVLAVGAPAVDDAHSYEP